MVVAMQVAMQAAREVVGDHAGGHAGHEHPGPQSYAIATGATITRFVLLLNSTPTSLSSVDLFPDRLLH